MSQTAKPLLDRNPDLQGSPAPVIVGVQDHIISPGMFFTPLVPEGRDQGDPFIVECADLGKERFRYYVYTTQGGGVVDDRAFPVYGSHDLKSWTPLGAALEA